VVSIISIIGGGEVGGGNVVDVVMVVDVVTAVDVVLAVGGIEGLGVSGKCSAGVSDGRELSGEFEELIHPIKNIIRSISTPNLIMPIILSQRDINFILKKKLKSSSNILSYLKFGG